MLSQWERAERIISALALNDEDAEMFREAYANELKAMRETTYEPVCYGADDPQCGCPRCEPEEESDGN